jgi:hypothetical protein
MANISYLPWLPEEEALLLKLWRIHGTNYEQIRIGMEKEGWFRTVKAIKHHCPASIRKAKSPVSIPIGISDPVQHLAICKPWGKNNVLK